MSIGENRARGRSELWTRGSRRGAALWGLLAALSLGCSDTGDVASADAATSDAATPDAATSDAATPDAGDAADAALPSDAGGPDAAMGSLSLTILFPGDETTQTSTFSVTGTSTGAVEVTLRADDGPWWPTNGVGSWDFVFEPGSLSAGHHVLTARALSATGAEVVASVGVEIVEPSVGLVTDVVYSSSVDGEPLAGVVRLPDGYDAGGAPVGLVMHLHGGGGRGMFAGPVAEMIDAHGWIGIAPDGREWGLADRGCPWETSAAYWDSPDPDVGPGQQDVLDMIEWAKANFAIDVDRIYLTGFSMGGRGTYAIGLKRPDLFAAIAPRGPAIDMFEIFDRRPEPTECKAGMTGGNPGDSRAVDTAYSVTSGRFLIENAYNLPVFHGHGYHDRTASNDTASSPFLHGWHITDDASWDGCHGSSGLCFGHTPTLAELHARHPAGYDWAFMFTDVAHMTDPRWVTGVPIAPDVFGTVDADAPTSYLGMGEFFSRHTRNASPATVVYKSYTDVDRRAYWVSIDISTPWENRPGAVRATRDESANSLRVELVRVARAEFDLELAGLSVVGRSLRVEVSPLVDAVFDPALAAPGEPLSPQLVFTGDFSSVSCIEVTQDGVVLDPAMVVLEPSSVLVNLPPVSASTRLRIEPC